MERYSNSPHFDSKTTENLLKFASRLSTMSEFQANADWSTALAIKNVVDRLSESRIPQFLLDIKNRLYCIWLSFKNINYKDNPSFGVNVNNAGIYSGTMQILNNYDNLIQNQVALFVNTDNKDLDNVIESAFPGYFSGQDYNVDLGPKIQRMRWSARNTLLEGYYRRNIQKLPPSKGKESYNYGKRAHSTTASEYWKTLTNQGQIDFFIDLLARATESTGDMIRSCV